MDSFLGKYVEKYDKWLAEDKISFSSRVVPVSESIKAQQWVLPTEQVMEVLRSARSIAQQDCICRTHYKRCDKPLDVCLVLNEPGERFVAKGMARPVSLEQAETALREANRSGLVHLALYMPDHEVFALCSCCSCCCHDMQLVLAHGRGDLMARSEYLAVIDTDTCTACGTCVPRCPFSARTQTEGQLDYDISCCLGCGLCVSTCPTEATTLKLRSAPPG